MSQIALPLDWPADDDDFIVAASNANAVRHLDAIGTWPVSTTLLVGPRKSGRSLFGRIFRRKTGGNVVDNADLGDERTLFNAWNEAQATRRPLLLIADAAPPVWPVALPDLASRLSATPVVSFADPDVDLIAPLLRRLLERRGLSVSRGMLAYLSPRAPRSHHALIELADALDTASLAQRRPVTLALARTVLDATGSVE